MVSFALLRPSGPWRVRFSGGSAGRAAGWAQDAAKASCVLGMVSCGSGTRVWASGPAPGAGPWRSRSPEEAILPRVQHRLQRAKPLDPHGVVRSRHGLLLLCGVAVVGASCSLARAEEKALLLAGIFERKGSDCESLSSGSFFLREILLRSRLDRH
jgi:hypothetical protein